MGGKLYRPIGRDWFDQGYWKVYDHPNTVEQFLGVGGNTPDGTEKLNEVLDQPEPEVYKCHDIDSGTFNRAITLKGFMDRRFEIVIASLPGHIEPYYKLCQLHPNKPKLIYQVGNAWNYDGTAPVKNIMASARMGGVSIGLNTIEYHQEFDTEIFKPEFNYPGPNIYSFVNCFDISQHFANDWRLFKQIEDAMPDWNFRAHGGQCRDGPVGPTPVLAQTMREARFIWHTKWAGDGYGHVIHNAPAVGRPLIVKKTYYKGKLAEPLLVDDVTCIVIDGLDYQQVINKIRHYSEPTEYAKMSKAAYDKFCEVVNFDKEQKEIEVFLTKLV